MANRPGGELAARPLLFEWIVDCSGSMSMYGKMDALNSAIRAALPEMRCVAENNPSVDVRMRTIAFSHGAKWLSAPVALHDFKWTDLLADSLETAASAADVVFLMDTSGSMHGEIETVRSQCVAFADKITKCGADVHIGLVGFDIGGHWGLPKGAYTVHNLSVYTIGIWPLNTPAEFKKRVQELKLGSFGGGGCYLADPSTVEVFPRLIRMFSESRREARRFLVIISDEIGSVAGVPQIVELLNGSKITAHVLGVSGPSQAHRRIAGRTGGQFWDILSSKGNHDFSGILGDVAETIGKEMKQTLEDGTISAGTDMGAALRMVAAELEVEIMPPRGLPPVLVLVSDGQPTDDFKTALSQLESQTWGKKSVRLAIGIGADANLNVLQRFIGTSEIKPMTADNPETLARYIRWVSTAVLESVSAPASQVGERSGRLHVALPSAPEIIAEKFNAEHIW